MPLAAIDSLCLSPYCVSPHAITLRRVRAWAMVCVERADPISMCVLVMGAEEPDVPAVQTLRFVLMWVVVYHKVQRSAFWCSTQVLLA